MNRKKAKLYEKQRGSETNETKIYTWPGSLVKYYIIAMLSNPHTHTRSFKDEEKKITTTTAIKTKQRRKRYITHIYDGDSDKTM